MAEKVINKCYLKWELNLPPRVPLIDLSQKQNLFNQGNLRIHQESQRLFITQKLRSYHYFDTQKEAGGKYTLSHGLIRSTDKYRVKELVEHIRGYEYFKIVFKSCDNLNRALHDRSLSHNRGGGRRGLNSDSECHQDY